MRSAPRITITAIGIKLDPNQQTNKNKHISEEPSNQTHLESDTNQDQRGKTQQKARFAKFVKYFSPLLNIPDPPNCVISFLSKLLSQFYNTGTTQAQKILF